MWGFVTALSLVCMMSPAQYPNWVVLGMHWKVDARAVEVLSYSSRSSGLGPEQAVVVAGAGGVHMFSHRGLLQVPI